MVMSCLERDLGVMLSEDSFGVGGGAVWDGDSSAPVPGIFDDEDVEHERGDGAAVLVPQVTFTCAASAMPELEEGDTLMINCVNYTVRFWQNDGEGVRTIFLERP